MALLRPPMSQVEYCKTGKLYPLADELTYDDVLMLFGPPPPDLRFEHERRGYFGPRDDDGHFRYRVLARATHESRPPKAGEWYLSGAIIEAYRAPNDLPTRYRIAKLFITQRRVTHQVLNQVPNLEEDE